MDKCLITTAAVALLRDITMRYTRHHEALETSGARMGSKIILSLRAHADDHAKLVGSRGKHIWALKQIFECAGRRLGYEVSLTLLDPVKGTRGPQIPYRENPGWKPDSMIELIVRIINACSYGDVELKPVTAGGLTTILLMPADMADSAARWYTEELGQALHALMHAIGKAEGHTVHIDVQKLEPAGHS